MYCRVVFLVHSIQYRIINTCTTEESMSRVSGIPTTQYTIQNSFPFPDRGDCSPYPETEKNV